jgi:predicted MPP superfamily phosphohydrolase
MLNFLHISDLHLTATDADNQFDHDLKIREALLDDVGRDGRTCFDGIFVTSDIAYHGNVDECARAKTWLESLREKTSSAREAIFVIPGNHDVNRAKVCKGSVLWSAHQDLRRPNQSRDDRRKSLQATEMELPTLSSWNGLATGFRNCFESTVTSDQKTVTEKCK